MDVPQYRDFYIRGDDDALVQFPAAVDERLAGGWARNPEIEERAQDMGETYFVYSCPAEQEPPRAAADLVVTPQHGESGLYVPNVVPSKRSELTPSEYNAIVGEFAERFGIPAAESLGLSHELTPSVRSVESYFDEEAFRCLKRFSVLANKSTGSSHPMDRDRWHDFIIAVHRSGRPLVTEVLERWLVEEQGWTEDRADRLGSQASFGVGLLAAYDVS